jgi:transcriptional regulator with XRE-family HTH domain
MRTSIQTVFGNHTRELRQQAGLTIEQLSEKSGFSSRRLRAIERGEINLNLGTLLILAMSLDTTLQDLLRGVAAKLHNRELFGVRIIPFPQYRSVRPHHHRQFGRAVPTRGLL